MLVGFNEIIRNADAKGYAVPAFNVYNMETVMGIIAAAEQEKAPVILQFYSRLATTGVADYLCPVALNAAHSARVPVCLHLDHGADYKAAAVAVKCGATGIMVDFSTLPLDENISLTAKAVEILKPLGIGVEGELGHIGKAADGDENTVAEYTRPDEALRYVRETGVAALAVMAGTAHGRYKKAPVLDTRRIADIKGLTGTPLVLHGGSGVPDEQIEQAIKAGIRKINFGTDVCYAFLDAVFSADRSVYALDLFMRGAVEGVCNFAKSKIKLLGAAGQA